MEAVTTPGGNPSPWWINRPQPKAVAPARGRPQGYRQRLVCARQGIRSSGCNSIQGCFGPVAPPPSPSFGPAQPLMSRGMHRPAPWSMWRPRLSGRALKIKELIGGRGMKPMLILPIVFSARILLSGLFLVSGVSKFTRFRAFSEAVNAYEIGPPSLRATGSSVIPPLETVLGFLWLTGLTRHVLVASLVVLAGFTSAMTANLIRGRSDIRCGCGLLDDGLGSGPIVRDFLTSGTMLIPLLSPLGCRGSPSDDPCVRRCWGHCFCIGTSRSAAGSSCHS